MKIYDLQKTNKIKADDLKAYSNEQILELHKNVYDCIQMIRVMKFDDVDPVLDKNKMISKVKKDLKLVITILKIRKLDIPTYGLYWRINQSLLKNKI